MRLKKTFVIFIRRYNNNILAMSKRRRNVKTIALKPDTYRLLREIRDTNELLSFDVVIRRLLKEVESK